MTLREFIAWHPGQALDVMTPEGRAFLEPNHIQSLLNGKSVIVCANGPKKASLVDADQMLGYYVISAYRFLPDAVTEVRCAIQNCYHSVSGWGR